MSRAGDLDRLMTIQQRSISRDAMGAAIEVFVNQYANVPCKKTSYSGREKFHVESGREVSYETEQFVCRYIEGITKRHRILFEGQYFDIIRVSELGRREDLAIVAMLAE